MLGTIINNSITFFRTEAAATAVVEKMGDDAEGIRVVPAKGREGCFVIEVYDTDDGMHLGYL